MREHTPRDADTKRALHAGNMARQVHIKVRPQFPLKSPRSSGRPRTRAAEDGRLKQTSRRPEWRALLPASMATVRQRVEALRAAGLRAGDN